MPRVREATLALLVAVYFALSIVAYTDYPRSNSDRPLNDLERLGLGVWRQHDCQACHQIYGFGGFLGPDLTNRVTQETPDTQFRSILQSGTQIMPAFHLPPAKQTAVLAFLRAVNRSGQSQPTPLGAGRKVNPAEHFQRLLDVWTHDIGRDLAPEARRGLETWSAVGCGGCHVPFTLGLMRAPDLSRSAIDVSVPGLTHILKNGRLNMPRFSLASEQVEAVSTFLKWVSTNRAELVKLNDRWMEREEFSWKHMPWFQYR